MARTDRPDLRRGSELFQSPRLNFRLRINQLEGVKRESQISGGEFTADTQRE